ncbi:MAG: DUF3810 domain-containing protein [Christensenellales bacterium]
MRRDKIEHFGKKLTINKMLWLLTGPVFYALFRLSFLWPDVTETVYSKGIFRILSQGLSTVTGFLPVSLSELLLYAFVLSIIVYIFIMIIHTITAKNSRWHVFLNRLISLLCVFSIIYAVFIGLWGFNYSRQTLSQTLRLDTSFASVRELTDTCQALIERAKGFRDIIPEDSKGIFSPNFSRQYVMQNTSEYYNKSAAATGYVFLGGSFGQAKPVLYSTGLSYAEISGIYFPFTGEANVNIDMPMLYFPTACLHEAAHQRGFAREDEANFLAFFVSMYVDDASVSYSGIMLALTHAMNNLYKEDRESYYRLRETYSAGMERDLQNNYKYWQQYDGPVSEASQTVNNTYLKVNMQQDGVKSYGRMVDLLIALWRNGSI